MANQPNSAQDLNNLIQDEGASAVIARFKKPPLSSRLLRDLYQDFASNTVYRFIAAYPLSPSDLLESLNEVCEDSEALALLALNPRTPNHLLTQLVENPDPQVRTTAAKNPQLTPRDMRLLSRDISRSVRVTMAGNPLLKPQFQAELALDGDDAVRAAIAGNQSLLSEIRFALSTDPSPIVRAQLIRACDDEEILLFWADSDREDLQQALLARPALSETILQSLRHSTHSHIRTLARDASESLNEAEKFIIARKGSPSEKEKRCTAKDLSDALQRIFSTDPNPSIRATLAAHPKIHPDFIAHFITTTDEAPLRALAANPNIPSHFLLPIAQTGIEGIAEALAYRKNIPLDVFEFLLHSNSEPFITHLARNPENAVPLSKTLNPYATHILPSVRAFVAQHAELTPQEWNQFLNDPAVSVRLALSANPTISDLQLEDLLQDEDPSVSETARLRWQSNLRSHRSLKQADPTRLAETKTKDPYIPDIEVLPETGVLHKLKTIFK